MIKQSLFALFTAGSLAVAAQSTSAKLSVSMPKELVLTAHLDAAPNDTMVYLYDMYLGETDTAVVKNHSFSFRKPMAKGGAIYVLQIGNIPDKRAVVQYLEDGKIDIKGKGDGFEGATYTGSAWVRDWQEVFNIVDASKEGDFKKHNEVDEKFMQAFNVGDAEAAEKLNNEKKQLEQSMYNTIKNWISKHPDSGLCGYLITCYVYNEKDKEALYDMLSERGKQGRIVQRWKNPGAVDKRPALPFELHADEGGSNVKIPGKPDIGTVAPAFTLPAVDGKNWSLTDFNGKYVFIDFWASWCKPCMEQVPFLKNVYEKFKGNKNFVMLGVSLDSKREAWTKAIEKESLGWLHLSQLKGWDDPVANSYGISFLPANVLIGPDGKIVAMDMYGDDLEKKLTELVK